MARTTWDSIEPYVFQQQYRVAQVRWQAACGCCGCCACLVLQPLLCSPHLAPFCWTQPPVLVHGVDVAGSRFFTRPIVRQAAEFAAQAHRCAAVAAPAAQAAAAAGVAEVLLSPLLPAQLYCCLHNYAAAAAAGTATPCPHRSSLPQRPDPQDAAALRHALHRDGADCGGAAVADGGGCTVRWRPCCSRAVVAAVASSIPVLS